VPSIHEQIAYYNAEWAKDERAYPNPWQLERALAVLEAIAELNRHRPQICELGAGTGWLSAMLGAIGDTTGVELSDVAVEKARARFPHVRFECADVLHWEYPRLRFDIAVSHEVIEHVDDQARYVDVAFDVLKPGGRLVLTTPNARAVAAMPAQARSNQPNEYLLDAAQLERLLERRFARVRIGSAILGGANAGIYRAINSSRLRRLLRRAGLAAAFERIARRMNFGLHLIAVADKA
jgi:SAM-dependent methyltransferase